MAGEIYLVQARCGLETTYGTGVTPTRRLYFREGSMVDPGGGAIRNQIVTGTRAQFVSGRPGASTPAGTFALDLDSGEILEVLNCGVDGTPTVSTPGGGTTTRDHVYVAYTNALDSMTLQMDDGARPWQEVGVYADALRIQGNARADGTNVLSGALFGNAITQAALSGSPTARTPTLYAGWETKLYIDAVAGSDNYGTTLIAAAQSVTDWDLPVALNNLDRVYTAANTRNAQAATLGTLEATGTLEFLASGAQALTNYNDFAAGTYKRLRVTFGDNVVLEGALNSRVMWDMQVMWMAVEITGEQGNVRTYRCQFAYIFDSTNNLACRVSCRNNRTAAF